MKALIGFQDGQFIDLKDMHLPVADLGVQRGYGIFDFLRTNGKHAVFINDHLDRFFHSASAMYLTVDYNRNQIIEIVNQLIHQNELLYSGIKILLTGGDSTDGYTITNPRLCIFQQKLQPPPNQIPEKGIHLISKVYQRQLPEVKTTDYLMAIWLQPWLKDQKGDDLLYCNENSITECPRSNIFMVTHENVVVTPNENMLWGITRKKIIEIADSIGITVVQRNITLDELYKAKEVFISSSTKRILPVERIDQSYTFSTTSNSVTRLLWDAFLAHEKSICQ